MKIGPREINKNASPYIVAEISGNHGGSQLKARQLIQAAKRAGANAVKTQCYEPDTITLDINKPDFIIQEGLWRGRTLYDLYASAHTPFKWHKDLYSVANDLDITIFSSVFDFSSVDLLERLGCPAYKIASMEIVDIPLIERVAQTQKPIIVSTGMADEREVQEANLAIGENQGAFLHCTSEYPATAERAGLIGLLDLRGRVPGREVGISDHTVGPIVPIASTALGASIIEKHLRLNGDTSTEDATFSMDEKDFKTMVDAVRVTHEAMKVQEGRANPSRQFRRSIYAVADIMEGEAFTPENIRSIRPGYGAAPRQLPRLMGRRAKQRYKKGDRIL